MGGFGRASGATPCPVCGGSMLQQYDARKRHKIRKCMTGCGHEEEIVQNTDEPSGEPGWVKSAEVDLPIERVDVPPAVTVRPATDPVRVASALADMTDWQGTALTRLKALIATIGQADLMKSEAERIHAALTIMGTRGLTELPWKSARPKRQHTEPPAEGTEQTTRSGEPLVCANCGRGFNSRYEYKIGPGGKPICKGHACKPAVPAEALA